MFFYGLFCGFQWCGSAAFRIFRGRLQLAISYVVPSRGIEPLLQDPQSCVLSVERQGLLFFTHSKIKDLHERQLISEKNSPQASWLGSPESYRVTAPPRESGLSPQERENRVSSRMLVGAHANPSNSQPINYRLKQSLFMLYFRNFFKKRGADIPQ